MRRIKGQPIRVGTSQCAVAFLGLLVPVVAVSAERLKLAMPELVRVAAMGLDVISHVGWYSAAQCLAHCAKRLAL
jgi:hypothetical protein